MKSGSFHSIGDVPTFSAAPEAAGFCAAPRTGTPGPSGTALNVLIVALLLSTTARADELTDALRKFDSTVLAPQVDRDHYRKLLPAMLNARIKEANAKSTREWNAIENLQQWEAFTLQKHSALKNAIGDFPTERSELKAQTTRTLMGEKFTIECVAFESRPNFVVTATLYLPDPLPASSPGIIIHPSHHNPKTEGELQDMGMTWARAGCHVLVMDQIGHGERRQHPFVTEQDYPKPFRASRQDYWFRYNSGMQLHLIGASLIGWQAYDLSRGIDYLLTRKGVDKSRIIMMGSVAGGGDPVAVAAALDERVACAVVFNFGGPQPESPYPLPEDAEQSFNYAGGGSWESTRNISFSARDGVLPWVIVGMIAPRRLIYAHEFSWDRERDPVWKRLQKIYAWHGKPEHLAFAHGHGVLRESGDKASHCNNIGAVHRKHIHAALKQWFNIDATEYSKRGPATDYQVFRINKPNPSKSLGDVALQAVPMDLLRKEVQRVIGLDGAQFAARCGERLGDTTPPKVVKVLSEASAKVGAVTEHRIVLEPEPGIVVPLLLLVPAEAKAKPGVVMMVSQHGKAALIKDRADAIAALLNAGIAVCLPDVRGTGETRLDSDRGRQSWDTSVSSTALMLGRPMVGQRLLDVRSVLVHLRTRDDVNAKHIAMWGDSLVPLNGQDVPRAVPHGVADPRAMCEPLGGMLAALACLYEPDVDAGYLRGPMLDFHDAVRTGATVALPHDAVVPGLVPLGDMPLVIAAIAPRPMRIEGLVNSRNNAAFSAEDSNLDDAVTRYARVNATKAIEVKREASSASDIAAWIAARMKE